MAIKPRIQKLFNWKISTLIATGSILTLAACGTDSISNLMNSDQNPSNELLWVNKHDTVPIKISYINDSSINNSRYDITPMLESSIYEAWIGALKLLNIQIAELIAQNPTNMGLELKNILLVEKKRLEIDAGGQLTSGSTNNLQSGEGNSSNSAGPGEIIPPPVASSSPSGVFGPPSPPPLAPQPLTVTNQKGVDIKLYLDGLTSEFSTLVKFVDYRTGRRIEIPLSENFSYWKMGFGTDSSATLDAASIVSMFLKLPPMVGEGLGSFLKNIGTLNFWLKLKSTQHWIDFSADEVDIRGIGKVSKLSYLLAKDIFSTVCQREGFSKNECNTKIYKWGKNPVTEQIKNYAVMPIVGCTKQFRNENTIPLYHHYVVAPKVDSDKLDFFEIDPNRETLELNIYKKRTKNSWVKQSGLFAGNYGTFIQELEPSVCRLTDKQSETKRCVEVRFGSHGYESRCNAIEAGTAKDYGYSFYSQKEVLIK